jgi:hypothetical protein
MRIGVISAALALLAVQLAGVGPAFGQATPAPAAHYSATETPVGKMLDDPAAAAVLKQMIPDVYANDQFQQAGRALTLKEIQQYEPAALSDENLAKIQIALDKIPAK